MEKFVITAVVVAVFVIPAIYYRIRDRQKRRIQYRETFGQFAEDKPNERQRLADAAYFQAVFHADTHIDDITAMDLDLQRVYEQFNQAQTSAGREYIYAALRMPRYDSERLKERDQRARAFDRDEKRRVETQMALGAVGRLKGRSLYDALQSLAEDGKSTVRSHVLMLVFFAITAGLSLWDNRFGILLLAGIACNMIRYFLIRRRFTEPMRIFGYLMSMMRAMNDTYARNRDLFPGYADVVQAVNRRLGNIRRFRFLISEEDGDLLSFLLIYVNAIFHFDCIYFGRGIRRLQRYKEERMALFEYLGEMELALSISSWRRAVPFWTTPDLSQMPTDGTTKLHFIDMVHPLLDAPVQNSLDLPGPLLITGSNASGKSTFLKGILVNVIMAQTIMTVTARQWESSYFKVMSSMAIRDNLAKKESYFIVEIKSLYRIVAADDRIPILVGVDEILRGTNTLERIAASAVILEELAKRRMIPIVATHDIELTGLLEGVYHNYHFREELVDGKISFDYQLYKGPSQTRNAIALLGQLGFADDIVSRANVMVARLAPQMHLTERGDDACSEYNG